MLRQHQLNFSSWIQLKQRTKDLEDKIETTKLENEKVERKKRQEIISSQSKIGQNIQTK